MDAEVIHCIMEPLAEPLHRVRRITVRVGGDHKDCDRRGDLGNVEWGEIGCEERERERVRVCVGGREGWRKRKEWGGYQRRGKRTERYKTQQVKQATTTTTKTKKHVVLQSAGCSLLTSCVSVSSGSQSLMSATRVTSTPAALA